MPDKTKIMLSEQELKIVTDTNWVLTKQEIIKKVYALFNEQVAVIGKILTEKKSGYPVKLTTTLPKISKGENYRSLPYVILDYPGIFGRENIFALRTMFWWGNFFSITLHLSGDYKDQYGPIFYDVLVSSAKDFYICVNDKAWEHHFEPSNYMEVSKINKEELRALFSQKDFIKIALKINLTHWNNIENLLQADYIKMLHLLDA
ncbi:MAG: hypothetical protein H7X88_04515 [Gloeobacteraceae cyanobacterium ES-bin-316]|nr:hypothetical protein [Ferruginibacter sp.]